MGFTNGQPSPQRLPLARGSMFKVGAATLSAQPTVESDRQPDVGAIDFLFHASLVTQQRARFGWFQQLVATRSGLPQPKQMWRPRELHEAVNHGPASYAAHVLGTSVRTFP